MRTAFALFVFVLSLVFVGTGSGASIPEKQQPKLLVGGKKEKEKEEKTEDKTTEVVFEIGKDVKVVVSGREIKRVDAIEGVIVVKGKWTVKIENRTAKEISFYAVIGDEELNDKLASGQGGRLEGDSEDFITLRLGLQSQKKKTD